MAVANKESSHTIVLIQYNAQANSRTYLDYETLPAALDGARMPGWPAAPHPRHSGCASLRCAAVCGLYEKELKTLNPQVRNLTYDIADLYSYLDQLNDLSCLV